MTRQEFIERHRTQIYGALPTDDAEITDELVNSYMSDAIGLAAKTNWKESIQIDGIAYVNNSFYSTFSGISIVSDDTDNLCYKLTLPQIPVGIGRNEGLAEIRFKDSNGFVSLPGIPVSINEWGYMDSMRPVPNKIFVLSEGLFVRMKTSLILTNFTATAKMASGGDSTDLNSMLNVPPDYFPIMVDYIQKQLMLERSIVPDLSNDGQDLGTSIK